MKTRIRVFYAHRDRSMNEETFIIESNRYAFDTVGNLYLYDGSLMHGVHERKPIPYHIIYAHTLKEVFIEEEKEHERRTTTE